MTQPVLTLTESNTLQALGNFLVAVLPTGTPVIVSEDNRVAPPSVPNYVAMSSPMARKRLATNLTTYADGYPSNPQTRTDVQATQLMVQVDVYGPLCADNAQVITTLFRSDWGVDQFATSGFDVTPLYCDDPRPSPFRDENNQIERRQIITCYLQANAAVTVSQDFASELSVGIVNVDVAYPAD